MMREIDFTPQWYRNRLRSARDRKRRLVYLGAILLGAAFCSIGLFASSVTKNQIIAFIIGMSICFALTLIDKMLFFLPESLIGILQFLGADYHFQNFSRGIVDSRDILYFLSVCFLMIYATYLVIQEKK